MNDSPPPNSPLSISPTPDTGASLPAPAGGGPRILVVEGDAQLADKTVSAINDHFHCNAALACDSIDRVDDTDLVQMEMVIYALGSPNTKPLDLINHIRDFGGTASILVLSPLKDVEQALDAVRHGASDIVIQERGHLDTLPWEIEKNLAIRNLARSDKQGPDPRLGPGLAAAREEGERLRQQVAQLKTLALTDPLTGLHNRRSLSDSLSRCFADANRYEHDLACVMVDLDNFKLINDTLGHQAGDQVLREASKALEANCRRSDVAGRYGGDEFLAILPQANRMTAKRVCHRVQKQFKACIEEIFDPMQMAAQVTMSMGVATLRLSHAANPAELISYADRALYDAKRRGKPGISVYKDALSNAA